MVDNNEQLLAEAHALRVRDQEIPTNLPSRMPGDLQLKKKKGSTRKRALTGAEASGRQQSALTRAQKRARLAQEAQDAKKGQPAPPSLPKLRTHAQKAAAILAKQQEIGEAEDVAESEKIPLTASQISATSPEEFGIAKELLENIKEAFTSAEKKSKDFKKDKKLDELVV
ncbi:MAG: hypothetical protein M1840_006513 [Geoglossum simile]|nr:MAG: hypothetical protein M1840_006513 [Geoglossum simile]